VRGSSELGYDLIRSRDALPNRCHAIDRGPARPVKNIGRCLSPVIESGRDWRLQAHRHEVEGIDYSGSWHLLDHLGGHL